MSSSEASKIVIDNLKNNQLSELSMKKFSSDHDGSEPMESDDDGSAIMEGSYENSLNDEGDNNSLDSKKSASDRNENSIDKRVDEESELSADEEDQKDGLSEGEVSAEGAKLEQTEDGNELSGEESHDEDSQNGFPENECSLKRSDASSPGSNSPKESPVRDEDDNNGEDKEEDDDIEEIEADDDDDVEDKDDDEKPKKAETPGEKVKENEVLSDKEDSSSSHNSASSKEKWKLVNGNKDTSDSPKLNSETKDKDGDKVDKEDDEKMDVDKDDEVGKKKDTAGEKDQPSKEGKDKSSAPIETRRRSLRTAARKPTESPSKPSKGDKSPRGKGKGPMKSKDDKSPSKDDKNHSSPAKPKEKPVPKLEPMSEEILQEAKFPPFLKDTITLGCYVPILDKNTNHVKLKEGESLLEAPSLSMPLLLKKPDAINKNVTLKRDKDETIKKGVFQMKPYFSSSVGEFLIGIGLSRVTEWYEKDMIKVKQRQIKREGQTQEGDDALTEHKNFFARAKQANEPFNFDMKKCENCEFKTESELVMQGHLLIPHITSRREFKCNFCTFVTRDHKAVLFHMEALHNRKGMLDLPSQFFYDCPFCTFETNLKTKATSHINKCQRYFLAARNQGPPGDWENPAVTAKPITLSDIKSYEMCVAAASAVARSTASPKNMQRGAGRPMSNIRSIRPATPQFKPVTSQSNLSLYQQIVTASLKDAGQLGSSLMQKHRFPSPKMNSKPEITLAVPGGQIYQVVNNGQVVPVINQAASGSQFLLSPAQNTSGPPQPVALFPNLATSGSNSRNSISLIPSASAAVKRLPSSTTLMPTIASPANLAKLQQQQQSSNLPKLQGPYTTVQTAAKSSTNPLMGNTTFVICEICDGYLKDLEQLRTHMLWIHKVKIHPKMLSSRPPLNCQKCQWRFFTDQGLERHLLGAHGLVTSNMQELANKNQDGGRCTVCGRVYVCKLVSHMNQVHKATLKPAHLSYKCTVCSATFNLYKLFENHVYMFHSGSVKRSATDDAGSAKKKLQSSSMELTVVPLKKVEKPAPASVRTSLPPPMKLPAVEPLPAVDPPRTPVVSQARPGPASVANQLKKNFEIVESGEKTRIRISNDNTGEIVVCRDCGRKVRNLYMHMRARHTRKCKVKLCRIEKCEKCLSSFDGMVVLHTADFQDSEEESEELLPK